MAAVKNLLIKRYGGGPLHLVLHGALIAVCAIAISQVFKPSSTQFFNYFFWLLGGAVLHDAVVLPAYVALDRAVQKVVPRDFLMHLRIPVAMSAVMFLVYLPSILAKGTENRVRASGMQPADFAQRWLLVTAVIFGCSAAILVLRLLARNAAARRQPSP